MLRLTMRFLEDQLSNGHLMCKCDEAGDDVKPTVSFFTDAMAEHGKAAMGGWQEHESGELSRCKWFYYEFSPAKEPWLFRLDKDQLHRKIAALEMLGTLTGIEAFTRDAGSSLVKIVLSAATDNQGNMYIVNRGLTTKFPGCCVLMQLAVTLQERNQSFRL
eukprot:1936331-Karenia_brevis.AAC.1